MMSASTISKVPVGVAFLILKGRGDRCTDRSHSLGRGKTKLRVESSLVLYHALVNNQQKDNNMQTGQNFLSLLVSQ
jgi:hypothetical protein